MSNLFNGAIMTIFAREILEGTIIIGQYRTVLLRSDDWQDPARQKQGLRAITVSALLASLVALIVTIAVAVPLALLSRDLDDRVVELIEGISKLVAAVCILQLSLKIPKFLGVYASKKGEDGRTIGLSLKSIRFNVAWNIWREMAEIGVFLIPFFLGEGALAIPLSGLAGIAVGALLGGLIYYANKVMKNKVWLAAFMAILLLMLSVGLFTMGCHEFEEVLGETDKVYNFGVASVAEDGTKTYNRWSEKKLPMAVFKPFGYSAGPTQLMVGAFWCWLVLGLVLHAWKYVSSKKIQAAEEFANAERGGKTLEEEDAETGQIDTAANSIKEDDSTDEYNEFVKSVQVN